MALLVDEAIWPWRGRRWAHLVSDDNLDELHELAHRIGMPYVAFQGDHYDVHEDLRRAAIDAGAVPTPGRDLVRALRAAGLRDRTTPSWEWVARRRTTSITALGSALDGVTVGLDPTVATLLAAAADQLGELTPIDEVGRAERGVETLVLVASVQTVDVAALGPVLEEPAVGVRVHRSSGERGTYLEVAIRAR